MSKTQRVNHQDLQIRVLEDQQDQDERVRQAQESQEAGLIQDQYGFEDQETGLVQVQDWKSQGQVSHPESCQARRGR